MAPTMPLALLLDNRLTPLERNAWIVFRVRVGNDGLSALTSVAQLRPFLATTPLTPRAAFDTVMRAVTVLRLTGWIRLARHHRDPMTGELLSDLYAVHDAALTPAETSRADPEFFTLLDDSLREASPLLRDVAQHTLRILAADPEMTGHLPPTLRVHLAQLPDMPIRRDDDEPPSPGASGEGTPRETSAQADTSPASLFAADAHRVFHAWTMALRGLGFS